MVVRGAGHRCVVQCVWGVMSWHVDCLGRLGRLGCDHGGGCCSPCALRRPAPRFPSVRAHLPRSNAIGTRGDLRKGSISTLSAPTNFLGTRIPISHARQGGTARDSHKQTFALMRSKLYFGILQKRAACSRTSEHPLPGISPYWEAIEPFLHVVKPGGIKI